MNFAESRCPQWMAKLILDAGGEVSFRQFMAWALNDPDNGFYGSGKLKIGKKGDFVTSSSMGPEFSCLLAVQINQWIEELLTKSEYNKKISIVDIGPGEGDFSFHLIEALVAMTPSYLTMIEIVLVEINEGMRERQKIKLQPLNQISIRWTSLEELSNEPIKGIFIANEFLDSLPLERICFSNGNLNRIGVHVYKKNNDYFINYKCLPLTDEIHNIIREYSSNLNLDIPSKESNEDWVSEIHIEIPDIMRTLKNAISEGVVLIIDYAINANNYYSKYRPQGTAISFSNQTPCMNLLSDPGNQDITSHLCIETLQYEAVKVGFKYIGLTKQNLALLSLGLGEKLSKLRNLPYDQISNTLRTRENLLSLIHPACLGEFKWMILQTSINQIENTKYPQCLKECNSSN